MRLKADGDPPLCAHQSLLKLFPMRLLLCTLFALLSVSALPAADLRIIRVWPDYRTAQSFVGIREYFTGEESPAKNQTLLRSQPGERAGFYFLTRLANQGPEIIGTKIRLEVVSPRDPVAANYIFPMRIPHGQHVYQIGLTGIDWPVPNEHPVAWRLTVIGPDGQELGSKQSFLWSKPDKP
jgi:hypothetical protein